MKRYKLKKVTIVIPIFNEAEAFPDFSKSLIFEINKLEKLYAFKVILVVDPSTDGTELAVSKLVKKDKRFKGVFTKVRIGHQRSIVLGMSMVSEQICITMDGDNQHPTRLISDMLNILDSTDEHIVQMVRKNTKDKSFRGWTTNLVSVVFYKFLGFLSDLKNLEGMSDFRALSPNATGSLNDLFQKRDVFIRGYVQKSGIKISYIGYESERREFGKSKYSTNKKFQLALSSILSFSKVPLRIGLLLGSFVALIALMSMCFFIILMLKGENFPSGWLSIIIMITLMSSTQLICTGLIGLYVGAIHQENLPKQYDVIKKMVN